MSDAPSTRAAPKVSPPQEPSNGTASTSAPAPTLAAARDPNYLRVPGEPSSISESIASAPNPHQADFSPLPFTQDESLDPLALDAEAAEEPGSPHARLLRAIAPPNAAQPNPNWQPPPPNASVNLFIGRALLSNGNDNWPLKPNDIVNWIRKHYPEEWDGDEGRCSAHRVRTYLARKGADMYYEKLNQGCIAGWRIRQNHLWRFENGGFQGRGMKQEEAMAQQQKENEAVATAVHKAAAAAALAQGHPGIKVSMSSGLEGPGPAKRARTKPSNGQARRKSEKKKDDYYPYTYGVDDGGSSGHAGPSTLEDFAAAHEHPHPHGQSHPHTTSNTDASGTPVPDEALDVNMVQQAMAAANAAAAVQAQSGHMDELEMGMQLPIEMQMHSGAHDDDERAYAYGAQYAEQPYTYAQGEYQEGYQQGQ